MRLVVASSYNVVFDLFDLPASIDVVMGALRMIETGIREPIVTCGQLIRK